MSQIEGAVPSAKGILFVLSTVLDPSALEPSAFAAWYENTHIQEVQSTGGISSTQRYESVAFSRNYRQSKSGRTGGLGNRRLDFDFATVYHMPDLKFRESAAFRGLDGQSAPREELLDGLFRRVSFVTRFAEEVSVSGPAAGGGDGALAPFVVTCAPLATGARLPSDLEDVKGLRRLVRYKVHEGSLLERFERSWLDEPREMVVLEFELEDRVAEFAETMGDGEKGELEVGYWMLRREYDGSERSPAPWSPKAAA